MSRVRCKNKNGQIMVYESTSYYDPVKRQSRPKRKYLGIEDPVTHELIPSSGQRGRRKKNGEPATPRSGAADADSRNYKALYEAQSRELEKTADQISRLAADTKRLAKENEILRETLHQISSRIDAALTAADTRA